jgi:hypothetical protein
VRAIPCNIHGNSFVEAGIAGISNNNNNLIHTNQNKKVKYANEYNLAMLM